MSIAGLINVIAGSLLSLDPRISRWRACHWYSPAPALFLNVSHFSCTIWNSASDGWSSFSSSFCRYTFLSSLRCPSNIAIHSSTAVASSNMLWLLSEVNNDTSLLSDVRQVRCVATHKRWTHYHWSKSWFCRQQSLYRPEIWVVLLAQ